MNYQEANAYIKAKVVVPTTLDAAALAISPNFSNQIKAHCFFSAKVSSANVLEALKSEVEKYTAGQTDLATARLKLKSFLKRQGVSPEPATNKPPKGMSEDEFKARKAIGHLSSTRRLNMILELNAKMAQATARDAYDKQPFMVEMQPNYIYDALDDARGGHLQYDGMILPKDSEFWATHTPPWEYGCRCAIYGTDQKTNADVHSFNPDTGHGKLSYPEGHAVELFPNASGFTFRIDEAFKVADMSMIKSIPLRQAVLSSLHKLHASTSSKLTVTTRVPKNTETETVLPENIKEIESYFENLKSIKNLDNLQKFTGPMGELLPEFTTALGLTKAPFTFSTFEFEQTAHLIDGSAIALLKKTLWNKNAQAVLTFEGNIQRLSLYHPETYEFCTSQKVGRNWELELVSAEKYK